MNYYDGHYLYKRLKKTTSKNLIVNTSTPKEYGQQLLNRKRK